MTISRMSALTKWRLCKKCGTKFPHDIEQYGKHCPECSSIKTIILKVAK